jgi:hypothetical protein
VIHRRPVVIANEIRMRRSQHVGAFLVTEGRDDRLLCERFISPADCKLVIAEGKTSVCEVIEILEDAGFSGVVGLIDADFDRIVNVQHSSPNIIVTESHDLECLLIRSSALEVVLGELASSEKLATFGNDFRAILLRAATPIGALRLYSHRAQLGLRFDGLRYPTFINRESLEIDSEALVKEVRNRTQRQNLPVHEILGGIKAVQTEGNDGWSLCCGDDLLGILSYGLRHAIGDNPAQLVSEEQLRRALRLAFSDQLFQDSTLSAALRTWEKENATFRVLKPPASSE